MGNKPLRKPLADSVGGGFDGKFVDDELLTFGTDADFDQLYDSSNDRLLFRGSTDSGIVSLTDSQFSVLENLNIHKRIQFEGINEEIFFYEGGFANSFYASDDVSTLDDLNVVIAPSIGGSFNESGSTLIGSKITPGTGSNTGVGARAGFSAAATASVALGYRAKAKNGSQNQAYGALTTAEGTYAFAFGRQNLSKDYTVSFASNGNGMDLQIEDDTDTKRKLFDRTTGSKVHRRETVSANITTSGQEILSVDSSGGAVTVTLASADAVDGKKTMVKRNGSNGVTVDTEGTETIDDGSSISLGADNDSVTLVYNADKTDWEVF